MHLNALKTSLTRLCFRTRQALRREENKAIKSFEGRFPAKKTQLPKSTARFPAKKRWHPPPPVGLSWDFPPPPPESVRTDGRMDGRTLTSQPKFFGSIGYQICLAMELRWQALPAGSATKTIICLRLSKYWRTFTSPSAG